MENVGLTERGPWEWTHERVGSIKLDPQSLRLMNDANGLLQHRLRMVWRFFNYEQWQNSARKDAASCRHVVINADRLAALKSLRIDSHALAVLTVLC